MFGQDLSDANLFRRVRRGDARAFGVLVRRHDATLRRLTSRLLAQPEQVDPVLQKAYTKAWRSAAMARLGSGRGDSVGNWLYRLAYNTCVDELRRQPRHAGPWPLEGPRVRLPMASVERRVSALRALSVKERIPLVLVDSEGFDVRAAARILQRKPAEVAADLAAARRRWRDLVIGPPEPVDPKAGKEPKEQGVSLAPVSGNGSVTIPRPQGSDRSTSIVHAAVDAFDAERFTKLKRWFKTKETSDPEGAHEGDGDGDGAEPVVDTEAASEDTIEPLEEQAASADRKTTS